MYKHIEFVRSVFVNALSPVNTKGILMEGDRGWEPRRKGGGRCAGGGSKESGKREGEIMLHCAVFRNKKRKEAGSNRNMAGTEIKR